MSESKDKPGAPEDAAEEMKRKFREALDRKNSRAQTGMKAEGSAKIHDSHGPAGHKREFRRKSG